jgi:hypothetical protein
MATGAYRGNAMAANKRAVQIDQLFGHDVAGFTAAGRAPD